MEAMGYHEVPTNCKYQEPRALNLKEDEVVKPPWALKGAESVHR